MIKLFLLLINLTFTTNQDINKKIILGAERLNLYDKNLSYIIWCPNTNMAAIIDPSVESFPMLEFIENKNLILEKIIITHTHRDHIHYLDDFIHQYPMINIYCHSKHVNLSNSYCIGLEHNQVISLGG